MRNLRSTSLAVVLSSATLLMLGTVAPSAEESKPAAKAPVAKTPTFKVDPTGAEAGEKTRFFADGHLTEKEFELLRCLLEAEGKALSRDEIMEKVWGYDRSMEIDTRTVDQHVARLRDKLGAESARVVTVKNVGYRLKRD